MKKLDAAAKLVLAICVAGALVAGVLLPVVGGIGIAARNSSSLLQDVPTDLFDRSPAEVTTVLATDGTPITHFYDFYRVPVALGQIPLVMQQAIISIEDSRFYDHGGLDAQSLARAVVANIQAGGVAEGGSTLTQQLVKNTLLYSAVTPEEQTAATDQTIPRKLREANLALAVEKRYTKAEILEKYLNLMNFGSGANRVAAYGVAAAAQTYFSKPVDQLTLPEAALLAGLVQSPDKYNPVNFPDAAKTRRDTVLDRMAQQGYISTTDAEAAKAVAPALAPGPAPSRNCEGAAVSGFFCDYLLTYLEGTAEQQGLGLSEDMIRNGGLTIQSTIDPRMQAAAQTGVEDVIPMGDQFAGIFTAVEPGSGKVRAMAINRRYGTDASDPTQTTVNLFTVASSGSGSTYKLFTAAAALEQLKGVNFTLTSDDPYVSRVYKDEGKPYDVQNAGTYPATLTLQDALYESSNTYFVHLEDELGSVQAPVEMGERLGLWYPGDPAPAQEIAENNGSFTLGPMATSPLLLATAYATVAAHGTRCWPTPVEQVLDPTGAPLTGADGQPLVKGDNCTPEVIAPGLADTISNILVKDVEPGWVRQTGANARIGTRPVAGKTGTTQDNKGVWFVGYTPQLVASVGVYDPVSPSTLGSRAFGGGFPATIWSRAMGPIMAPFPELAFAPSDPAFVNGNTFTLRVNCSGQSTDSCSASLRAQGLNPVVAARKVGSSVSNGRVAYTSPGSGGKVTAGQTVTIFVSDGSRVVTAPAPTTRNRPTRSPAPTTDPGPPTTLPGPDPGPIPIPGPGPGPTP